MSERTMEKARQVVHRLSEWYFAEGGDNDPDSPIDREDLDALHDLVRTAEATAEMERCHCGGDAEIERLRREVEEVRAQVDREAWDDARRFVGLDPAGDDNMTPPAGDAPAHPVVMAQPDEGVVL